MDQPKVLVVGSANIDLVTRVNHCPRPGETLLGRSFQTVPGGKGANQAVAAARLGAQTRFAGSVGNDAFGQMLRTTLSQSGVDIAHLKTDPHEPTGTAVIFVADEGQNAIVVTPAANRGLTPDDVHKLEPLFAALDAVLMQLEIRLETVEAALDLARRHNVLSVVDAGPAQEAHPAIVAKADICSPNETEAEAMTGVPVTDLASAQRAAEKLRNMGAKEVVVKMGAQGALYLGKELIRVPGFKVDPVDTTAAGDAFTAALALVWNRAQPREAIQFANAAGALAATVAGAQPSMPTRAAVNAFLAEHGLG
jgi:ribokinase